MIAVIILWTKDVYVADKAVKLEWDNREFQARSIWKKQTELRLVAVLKPWGKLKETLRRKHDTYVES